MIVKKILIFFIACNFSSIYAQEYPHPNNSYNKAVEYYQQGDLGNAMFYTKRAMLLKPADSTIRKLFFDIRQDIGLPQIYSSDGIGGKALEVFFGRIPPHINALIGMILFLIGSCIVSLFLLNRIQKNKFFIISVWSVFIGAGILFVQASIQYYAFFLPDQRIVLMQTKAYEEPSFEGKHLLDLPAGTEITVIAKQNTQGDLFYLVRTLDGKEYWIKTSGDFVPELWANLYP